MLFAIGQKFWSLIGWYLLMFSMDTSRCQIPPTRYNYQIIYKKKSYL